MDNHPIPQDVTGFQFRLIGDMTIKQFAYVAVGAILAFVMFAVPAPILLKLPFVILFAGTGVALAFLPLEGRPMDVMLGNFFKALFNPEQYMYQKTGGIFLSNIHSPTKTTQAAQTPTAPSSEKLSMYLSSLHAQHADKLDDRESKFLNSVSSIFTNPTVQLQPIPALTPSPQAPYVPPAPLPEPPQKTPEKITETPTPVAPLPPTPPPVAAAQPSPVQAPPPAPTTTAEPAPAAVVQQVIVPTPVAAITQPVPAVQHTPTEPPPSLSEIEHAAVPSPVTGVKQAPIGQEGSQAAAQAAIDAMPLPMQQPNKPGFFSNTALKREKLPTPEFPNLITGIVLDPRGNVLPNILIEIKDTENNPVRAFKTNKLGQFASATPLPNGTFTVEFEDPKGLHSFSQVPLQTSGAALEPLEIVSTDDREKLRKELFN